MNKILYIFYAEFIPEASRGYVEFVPETSIGSVERYFRYNILFNTLIEGKQIKATKIDNTIIPTLKITSKDTFDNLLVKYVSKCLESYEFEPELDSEELKIKKILVMLFGNARIEDFEYPINFLETRIAFLEDKTLSDLDETFESKTLNSKINVKSEKAKISNEAPYKIKFELEGIDGSYALPSIYLGINGDEAYIYAIQREKPVELLQPKKTKRALYKLDIGLDVKNETFENFDVGNLKDITPSFLLVVNILTGILKEKGITKIIVPSLLPSRWNAKEMANQYKARMLESSVSDKDNMVLQHELIQRNLTEKLVRTFLRLAHHHTCIDVASYPGEISTDLALTINGDDKCNNPILEETFNINGGRHV